MSSQSGQGQSQSQIIVQPQAQGHHGHSHGRQRHLEVVFTRKMEERRIFMEELKEIRAQTYKRVYKEIRKNVGPKWYQVLSVKQRRALDTLNGCLYKDLLEGRPVRTVKVLHTLGVYPRPARLDLLNCMYIGRNDSKDFLAELFLFMHNHYVSARLPAYDLNARLILSSIFYLGLNNLLAMLEDVFKPDTPPPPPPKPKPKPKPQLASPYLQEFVIPLYKPMLPKRKPPLPLPTNLGHLNEPYEEDPPVPRPPPPPPPPPPPKKRLPESLCAQLSDYRKIEPYVPKLPPENIYKKPGPTGRRARSSKLCLVDTKKKTYGLGQMIKARKKRRRKPKAPSTGLPNAQYTINGVHTHNGRAYFILGSVSIIPPDGDLIHGGYFLVGEEYVRVHLGIRAHPVPPPPAPCDCLKKWSPSIFRYLEETKCHCGHRYDFGNEGSYPIEEPQFFDKPTGKLPYQFNYTTIYEVDPRMTHVEREVKRHWETDSVLHSEDENDPKKKKNKKKKVVKKSSTTCLGDKPTIDDYLRCALRLMRRVNIASKLPDVHLAPELNEWMRRRIYGPYTRQEKKRLLRKSTTWWTYLKSFQKMGLGKCHPPIIPMFSMITTWKHKQSLNDSFRKYIQRYKFQLLKTHAYFNNLFWGTMFQAKFPDKHFRDIYFSYLVSRVSDVHVIHPYDTVEISERTEKMRRRRLVCLPKGAEDLDKGGV